MKLKTKLLKLRHDGHITDVEYTIIINALHQFSTQPPKIQPCEDCISREAVIKHLDNITMDTNPDHYGDKDKWHLANGFNLCKVDIETYIENLPPVTPQPTDAVSRDATNEGCWREKEEYFYGLKSKRIWLEPIQALEQEPCEDAISRQEAIKEFQIFREYSSNRSNADWVDRIETVLMHLPPVAPQAKPCEDAIGMDSVIEWLKNKDIIKLSSQEEIARKELKELLSVTPQDQQPCETPRTNLAKTSQDCISRDEAIRIAEQGQIQGYEWQFKKLCNLPPVTPQPKTGKWIRSWCEWQQYLECSKCGYETGLRCDTNYCPNCGARMTESEGENDEL